MSVASISVDSIAENMREAVTYFANLLTGLAEGHILGLTCFGSVVGGPFDPDRQTARSALVLDEIDLEALRRIAENGLDLGKRKLAAPLIMTPDYLEQSRDTFPLELLEMQQKRTTVLGEDHFADLTFEDEHIRLQCERELKAVLLGMRQGLLAAAGRQQFIHQLELDVMPTLVRTLRGMLWLKGVREAKPAAEVLTEAEKLLDKPLDALRAGLVTTSDHGWNEFDQLYRAVAMLGEVANAW
jgi:hypothetical protein